jgi:hypothetical protein
MSAKDTFLQKMHSAGIFMLLLFIHGSPQVDVSTTPADSAKTIPLQTPDTLPFEKIAGPLPDTVRAHKKPYLVVADIEVPINKTVTIEKGVVFLFKAFTGMHVLGNIDAQGTIDAPVIFTSENDRISDTKTSLRPVPYDWDGINVHESAVGSKMSFCKVKYSVYGIISETRYIKLSPVSFSFNGKSDLVIEGNKQPVTNKPFWYKNFSKILIDPLAYERKILRYGGIIVALAAGVGTVYYGTQWNKAQIGLSRISTDDPLVLYDKNDPDWKNPRDKRNNFRNVTIVSGALAVLGMIGVQWSFRF